MSCRIPTRRWYWGAGNRPADSTAGGNGLGIGRTRLRSGQATNPTADSAANGPACRPCPERVGIADWVAVDIGVCLNIIILAWEAQVVGNSRRAA